jgi:hypothetical protein
VLLEPAKSAPLLVDPAAPSPSPLRPKPSDAEAPRPTVADKPTLSPDEPIPRPAEAPSAADTPAVAFACTLRRVLELAPTNATPSEAPTPGVAPTEATMHTFSGSPPLLQVFVAVPTLTSPSVVDGTAFVIDAETPTPTPTPTLALRESDKGIAAEPPTVDMLRAEVGKGEYVYVVPSCMLTPEVT